MKKATIAVLAAILLLSAALCGFVQSTVAEATEVSVHLWNFEEGGSGWLPYLLCLKGR